MLSGLRIFRLARNSLDSLIHSLPLIKNLRILGRNRHFWGLKSKLSLQISLHQGICQSTEHQLERYFVPRFIAFAYLVAFPWSRNLSMNFVSNRAARKSAFSIIRRCKGIVV